MKLRLFFSALSMLIIVAAFDNAAALADTVGPKSGTILIIRHAEEPEDGAGLSAEGEARAKAYAGYFSHFTIDGHPLKIGYLFAAADSFASRRPSLTLEPTAQALGLAIDSQYANKRFSELVDRVVHLPTGANVLICWHHGEIPALLDALGADSSQVLHHRKWPADEYGWVILLRYDANGQLQESKRINEHLMNSDEGRD